MRLSSLITGLTRALLPENKRTDVDFRPLERPQPDVIAGWERRPHVPGSQDGRDVR
jgi:hypothetical protein